VKQKNIFLLSLFRYLMRVAQTKKSVNSPLLNHCTAKLANRNYNRTGREERPPLGMNTIPSNEKEGQALKRTVRLDLESTSTKLELGRSIFR